MENISPFVHLLIAYLFYSSGDPMADLNEQYGITGPVSLKESSPAYIAYSKELSAYLEESGFYESEESAQTRERVLGKLDFLVKKFVSDCAPDGDNTQYGGKIFTFGSYRLGVHDRGADIDALCVVPRHVHRDDFFTVFYEQLRSDSGISELSKVEDAYVPLIKMRFYDIPIDVTFARLNISVIKENINLLNDSLLRTMDEKCITSLNGSRATDVMLRLVPDTAVFHGALRTIKFWAQRRYVYGASYGYFGGIAYSISVARVCQMYPNACAFDIVCKFFETFSAWKWPAPVMLREVPDMNYNLKVWDPKTYPSDRYHKMPVITPVYPQKCATHNVTQSTAAFITAEFTRAHEILSSVGTLQSALPETTLREILSKLFEFSDFFKKHRLFIEVVAAAPEEHYLLWKGFVESKIRLLSMKLEAVENVSAAIPFPKMFKTRIRCDDPILDLGDEASKKVRPNEDQGQVELRAESFSSEPNNKLSSKHTNDSSVQPGQPATYMEMRFFIAMDVLPSKKNDKKLYVDAPIKEYLDFVNSWEKKHESMTVEVNAKRKKDVQAFLRKYYVENDS